MGRFPMGCALMGGLAALLCSPAAAGAVQAAPARHHPLPAVPASSPNPGADNILNGVSAVSAADAWAVGYDCPAGCGSLSPAARTLILHWNGRTWSRVDSPNPSRRLNHLYAVTARTATDAWAVGDYCISACASHPLDHLRTLILHWNGRRWSRVASPNRGGGSNTLLGVTATGARHAWVAGDYCSSGCSPPISPVHHTLILRWNGRTWRPVSAPNRGDSTLHGISATSRADAWAVGDFCRTNCDLPKQQVKHTLILHWNGSAWSTVAGPDPSSLDNELNGVAARSATDAWAVGTFLGNAAEDVTGLILHWDGKTWSTVSSASPLGGRLSAVSATSASDAWAVGSFGNASGDVETLILHWNGAVWARVPSPSPHPKTINVLAAVSAPSAANAWAAGNDCAARCNSTLTARDQTLLLHWDGSKWSAK